MTLTGVEDVTKKTDKCPKWKNKKKVEIFCLPHTYSSNCSSQSNDCCEILLEQNSTKMKSSKSCGGGKWSLTLERAMILCL